MEMEKSKIQILHPNGNGIEGGPWYTKVQDEAMNFAMAVRQNFEFGLNTAVHHLPKQDREHKAKQLDVFIDAMVGVCVQCISEFANAGEQMEAAVVAAVQTKFQYVREAIAERKAQLEAEAKKLVDKDGKPIGN
jgi:hypothetical protein